MTLDNKVAVITGGSGAIGYAVATRLSSLGVRVFILVRRKLDQAQAMVEELPNSHLQHSALLADVTDSAQIQQALDTVTQQAGRCDILINAAGMASHSPLLEISEEKFDQTIAVNLKGTWLATRAFYPLLKSSGDGLIVNISSIASIAPQSQNLVYAIAKAGVNIMTQTMTSLGPEVRFVAVAPSMLPNLTSGYPFIEKEDKYLPPGHVENYIERTPLRRLCTTDDVADVVESVATKMKFYNGHLIVLDGGLIT